jgi:hypothetical protein
VLLFSEDSSLANGFLALLVRVFVWAVRVASVSAAVVSDEISAWVAFGVSFEALDC